MKIDFSKIKRGADGTVEPPVLVLKNLASKSIGTIGSFFDLKISAKYGDVSEMSFSVPAYIDGAPTPYYSNVTGNKIIVAEPYGAFILTTPSTDGDGVREVKSCVCKSREYEMSRANLTFEGGTYCLYNPVSMDNTVVGWLRDLFPNWSVGYVSPTLYGRYRTFDDTDEKALDFIYGAAQESYGCVFVFDTLNMAYDIIDADEEPNVMPVYLSYDNLVKQVSVSESSEEQFTVLDVRGADPLDIRSVNPIGSNKIYNLDFFIENGDIKGELASKWRSWETLVAANQDRFISYMMLYSSETSRLLAEKAVLSEEESELVSLKNIADVTLQGFGVGAKTEEDVASANKACTDQELVVAVQSDLVKLVETKAKRYLENATEITKTLSVDSFFTADELSELRQYFIEDAFLDDTFATFDVDVSGKSNAFSNVDTATVSIQNAVVKNITLDESVKKTLIHVEGGSLSVIGVGKDIGGEVAYCTIEEDLEDKRVVVSAFLGTTDVDMSTFTGGNLSVVGASNSLTYDDTSLSIVVKSSSLYFTPNATEYQRFNVALDLYRYATEKHKEIAYPVYEFSVSSGNFLFDSEFKPFADKLELGSALYLDISDGLRIKPLLIEAEIGFDDPSDFNLVFSNKFRRPDKVNNMKDLLRDSYNSNRSLDMSKYKYGAYSSSGAESQVKNLIESGLDAATSAVMGGFSNSVKIDGSGITIREAGANEYIRMNNGMIAFFDSNASSAKMAIGKFVDDNTGEMYGVVAPSIVGTLLAGENLVIENKSLNGLITQFKVDSSGAFLHNSRFYLQHETGGKIAIDPLYGVIAGTKDLYTLSGTTLSPEFIDENGSIVYDDDGMPVNTNFFIDARTGNAYLRGTVYAENGSFTGDVTARNFYFSDGQSVKTLLSSSQKQIPSDYLDVKGITVKDNSGNVTFSVDESGNVTLGGAITWNNAAPQVVSRFSSQSEIAAGKTPLTDPNWHVAMLSTDKYRVDSNDGGKTWGDVYQFRGTDGTNGVDGAPGADGKDGVDGKDGEDGKDGSDATVNYANVSKILKNNYNITSTNMTSSTIESPTINAAVLNSPEINAERIALHIYDDSGESYFGVVNNGATAFYVQTYGFTGIDAITMIGGKHIFMEVESLQASTLDVYQIGDNTPEASYKSNIALAGKFYVNRSRLAEFVFDNADIDFTGATITWGNNKPTAVFA